MATIRLNYPKISAVVGPCGLWPEDLGWPQDVGLLAILDGTTLARETARSGITCNCVAPGPTDTPLFQAQPEKMRQALLRVIPTPRAAVVTQPLSASRRLNHFCRSTVHPSCRAFTGTGGRAQEALDAELDYFRRFPEDSHREWTLQAVEPELTVVYTPNLSAPGWPDERLILVDVDQGVNRVLNSDYFGESKKGGLRMWNKLVYERGGLAPQVRKQAGQRAAAASQAREPPNAASR